MNVSENITIEKPKEEVWAVIKDIENCPKFISSIIGLEILNKPESSPLFVKFMSACMAVFVKNSMKKVLLKDLRDIKNYLEPNHKVAELS